MSEKGISEEFSSKLDKLVDDFDSSNPDFIFCKDDFDPMEFCVSPASNKEEGKILKKFQRVIEMNGGAVKFNLGAGGHHVIKLVHYKMASFHSDDDLFLAQFVLDSLETKKLQNLCDYRAAKTKFPDVDPNHIMRGLKSWKDAKRKRDTQEEENSNVVIDSSDSEENMRRREYSKKPGKRRKQYYSIDEERDILNYIVKKHYFFRVKGNAIWKDMEKKKVCGSRTWQSMKERYLNHIIPKIGQFNLSPRKEKKVLIPFRSNNVKISHDAEIAENSNIETNQGESVEDDHDESKFREPSLGNGTKQTGKRKSDNKESENKQLDSESLASASCGDNTHESKISESPVNDKNPRTQVIKEPTTNEEVQNVPNVSSPKSSNKVIEELISIWDLSEPETEPNEPHIHSRQDISKSFQTYDTSQNKSYHEKIPNNECSGDISTQRFEVQNNEVCVDDIEKTQEFEPEEISNNGNLGSTKRFVAQNNEVCVDDIEKPQEFEPKKISNKEECSGNLGSTQRFVAQNNEVCVDDIEKTQEFEPDEISDNEECSSNIEKTQEFEPNINNCVVNLGKKLNVSFQAKKFDRNRSDVQTSSPKKNNRQKKELIKSLNNSHLDNDQDINTSSETVIFETSSVYEKSRCCDLSGNSNDEIPLQINRSVLTSMKQNKTKLSMSSQMESQSSAKKKRFVKETGIDISNKKRKSKKHKISQEKSSNSNASKRRNIINIYSSSSGSEDDIAPKNKRVKNYTEVEDELILDYISKYNLFNFVKGNTMWVDLEKKKLLPGRSWHSLKERFRKRILPRLHKYTNATERVIEKFERYQNPTEIETKPSSKYSKAEDTFILEFIIKYRRYKEIKAKSMWMCMSNWDPLKTRTWESLKNRFLKNIAPNIERYKISDEAIERFKKALKKKKRPPNFKKYQIPRKSRTKKLSRQCTMSKLNYTSLFDDESSSGQSSQPSNTVSNDISDVFDTYESSSFEADNESVIKVNEGTSRNKNQTKHPFKGSESSSRQNSQNPKQDKNVAKSAEDCEESYEQENALKRTVMKRKLFTKTTMEMYEKTPHNSGLKKDIFSRENKKPVNNVHSQADELIGENQRLPPEKEVNAVTIHSQNEELVDKNQMSPPEEEVNSVTILSKDEELVDESQRSPPEEEVNPVSIHSQDEELVDKDQGSPPEEINPVNIHPQGDELAGENKRSPSEDVNPVNAHYKEDVLFGENLRSPSEEVANPVNIHSQADELVGDNQRSPSEVANPGTIPTQADKLVGDNQMSTSEVVNLVFSKNLEQEKLPVIENYLKSSSSSGLNVSVSEANVSKCSNERSPKAETLNAAKKRMSPRSKHQKSVLKKTKSENAITLTTRLRRRVIKSSI